MSNRVERKARKDLIDPALEKAGWGEVGESELIGVEIPVDGFDPEAWKVLEARLRRLHDAGVPYDIELPKGVSDYVIYRPNGEIIAVVEAKRTSVDPRLAEAQTHFYVTEIEKQQSFRPFAFMTNGYDTYFWDVGRANKRLVSGFFSPADLDNLLYSRQNQTPLSGAQINMTITDRVYQQEAIRRVCEVFEQGKRKALVVMATGTGKTRVAMSLVDIFLRTNQARHILFVADRDALVEQAKIEGFKAFVPDEPCARIHTYRIDKTNRLYVVTLQTLSKCFEQFTPAFFDLIIFDEVHRSIFNKWNEVLHYFDARMIGLTATPADFIDRNTFLEFDCHDEVPTFLYEYEDAIRDGYLVDYSLYVAQTKFQRKGIRGVDLTEEERNALIEQGIDPDDIDYSGTQLEKDVSNRDTLRKQWEEIMEVCYKDASGQLPGKTIVFAMTQEHALRQADVFEEMYPQYPGLVQVITYKSEYKGTLIDNFKKKSLPRIAVSVDMLETGIDVPEAVNLVFMRPVQSRIKLEQMIGRGTRSHETCNHAEWLPNGHKDEFLIIDFWENDFSKRPQEQVAQSLPVLVTIFNIRLELMELYLGDQQLPEAQRLVADLRAQIALIPTDSFSVKRIYPEIERAWQDSFWRYLTLDSLAFLRFKVGPLLRYAPGVDVQAATFTSKVERLKLQILTGKDPSATAQSIAEDVSRLPDFVYEDPQREASVWLCLTPQLRTATVAQLNEVIDTLADQMRNRRTKPSDFLELDLPDLIDIRGYILLYGGSQPVYVEEYRQRVEERILDLVAGHPTIEAIETGRPVTDWQLIELERTLRQELGSDGVELSEANIRKAYGLKVGSLLEFLRRLLEIEGLPDYQDIVRRQFAGYIAGRPFNADQIRFLRAVQNVFLQRRRLELADLYEPPLTSFGHDAAERWFTEDQVRDMLAFVDTLTVTGE
ncbi:MAG: DEAD/DEAH box helicase [Chloroflexi bacterium]|nr:DEAD/DEAH box helicase [Chloroflexota bacterium]